MSKKRSFILFIMLCVVGFSVRLQAQQITDSAKVEVDSVALVQTNDTTFHQQPDSLSVSDTITKKSIDSTYYSLYGDVLNLDDSIPVKKWQNYYDTYQLTIKSYDSTLNDFQVYHPAFRNSIANVYLGENGLATKSALFFNPNPDDDYLFLQSFTPYIYQAKTINYYNVKRPFTKFTANIGPKEEQNIRLLHTQNINPYLNGFFKFNSFTSDGVYVDQAVKNNTGVIGGSYLKGRWATHINYIFSKVNPKENGGITDTEFIVDTVLSTNEVPTRLANANNLIKDRRLYFDQKVGFVNTKKTDTAQTGKYWFSLQYNFERQTTFKIYTDNPDSYVSAVSGETLNLYENNYSGTSSFDSSFFESKTHFVRLNLEEIPGQIPSVGAFAGLGYNSTQYGYFNKDTLFNYTHDTLTRNYYAEAGIYRLLSDFLKFKGSYRIFLAGYKQTDMALKGMLQLDFGYGKNQLRFVSNGKIELETPDYFYQRYYSNHYRWEKSLKQVKRNTLSATLHSPRFKTSLGADYSLLKDYVYFNSQAIPEQESDFISVIGLNFKNHLTLWRFNLKSQLHYQKTGNTTVIPLPDLAANASLYYEQTLNFKHTGGKMKIQLGGDVYYFSEYYAQAYSPALAQFYNQNEQLVGNYPYLGAFFNMEIKRLRFFVKGYHLNFNKTVRNYFAAPNYPTPQQTIKYGLTWTFYN